MKTFYKDNRSVDEINVAYAGKRIDEMQELEKKRFDEERPKIDSKHDAFIEEGRCSMLTVQKLVDFLKTQDPNACILAYEPNSDAYIEQLPSLPSPDICNVAMAKKEMEESLRSWYKGCEDAERKIADEISTVFRYANDRDVVIRFN